MPASQQVRRGLDNRVESRSPDPLIARIPSAIWALIIGGAIFFCQQLSALTGTVGVFGKSEHLRVAYQAVDPGRRNNVVGKGLSPTPKREI